MPNAIRLVIVVALLSTPAIAQDYEIAPLIGWRVGGVLEIGGDRVGVDDAIAQGLMVSFARGRGRMLDVVVSRQATRAVGSDPFDPRTIDLVVIYLELGGRHLFMPAEPVSPYIGLTAGGTIFTFDDAGTSAHLSFAAAVGSDFRMTEMLALRLDGRFHTTISASGGELACTNIGTCVGFVEGSTFTQWTASTALVFRF